MPSPVKEFADDWIWIGYWQSLCLQFYRDRVTSEGIRAAHDSRLRMKDRIGRTPDSFAVIVTGGKMPKVGDEERKLIKELQHALSNTDLSSAQVIEGTGFVASTTRAILAGINMFSRSHTKVFDSVGAAALWLSPRTNVSAPDLVLAVEQARADWASVTGRPQSRT